MHRPMPAIVAAAPDHVASVRNRFLDVLDKNDQKVLADIFDRVASRIKDIDKDQN